MNRFTFSKIQSASQVYIWVKKIIILLRFDYSWTPQIWNFMNNSSWSFFPFPFRFKGRWLIFRGTCREGSHCVVQEKPHLPGHWFSAPYLTVKYAAASHLPELDSTIFPSSKRKHVLVATATNLSQSKLCFLKTMPAPLHSQCWEREMPDPYQVFYLGQWRLGTCMFLCLYLGRLRLGPCKSLL